MAHDILKIKLKAPTKVLQVLRTETNSAMEQSKTQHTKPSHLSMY